MTVTLNKQGSTLEIFVSGRLDTTTAPELENALGSQLEGIESLTLDFGELAYISSAGLRVLLGAQKAMNRQGSMTVRNVSAEIMEIFEITGFADILTIE